MANRKIVEVTINDCGGSDEVVCRWFSCPECKEKIRACFKFCACCGAKLEWRINRKNAIAKP